MKFIINFSCVVFNVEWRGIRMKLRLVLLLLLVTIVVLLSSRFQKHFNDRFVLCACNNRLNLFKLPMKMRKMSMTERGLFSLL